MYRIGAVVMLIAAGMAGCAGLEDFQVAAPAWTSGNEWIYDVTYSFEMDGDEELDDLGTEVGTEALRVLRHTDTVGDETVYLVAHGEADRGDDPFGEDSYKRLMAYRAENLASVDADEAVLWDCIGPAACLDRLDRLDLADETGWPFPALQFPLEDGASWEVPFDGPGHTLDAVVEGSRSVTTPAGTFDAVRVVMRGDFQESDSYDDYEESVDLDITWRLDYSLETRSVVQSVLHAEGSVQERDEGVRTEMQVEIDIGHELAAYTLDASEPMSAEALWDFFDMERYQPRYLDIDPVGSIVGDGTHTLDLSTRTHNLPVETTYTWNLTRLDGSAVDTGQGMRFYPEVEMGGVYVAYAAAHYNGTLLAQAQRFITTHLEAERSVACDGAQLAIDPVPPQGGCDDVVVTVHEAAETLVVTADVDAPGSDWHLDVIDPEGDVIATGQSSHELDLRDQPVGDYTLRLIVEQGFDVTGELSIFVGYAAPEYLHSGPLPVDG